MRAINRLIIHCSDTPNGRYHTAKDIDQWHKSRGWKGIGYHYVIRTDGHVERGRKIEDIGAHTKGYNSNSIGICLIGRDKYSLEQWSSLFELLLDLKEQYKEATIHGHNEFANKGCPNIDIKNLKKYIL